MEIRTYVEAMSEGDRFLREPRIGGSVWPQQQCPGFTERLERLGGMQACWFCRYADFHLRERVALDVGICCWQKIQVN